MPPPAADPSARTVILGTSGHPLWHYAGFLLAPLAVTLVVGRAVVTAGIREAVATFVASVRSAPVTVRVAAAGSAAAAAIHLSVCPEHYREHIVYGLFFTALAAYQLAWSLLVVLWPSRRLLFVGAVANVLTIALWAVSRTVGVPVGPEALQPESFGGLDIAATAIEVLVVAGSLLAVLRSRPARDTSERTLIRKVRALLPEGSPLPDEVWRQRHRWISGVLWAHVPGIVVFAAFRGYPAYVCAIVGIAIVPFGVASGRLSGHRRLATVTTALGLLTCSAELVWLSGGAIEMHFHYFVMVGIITLYQDWWPFLVAIGYVVLQHGLAGALHPSAVYDHQSAIEHPWQWAAIHGVFILAMSAAGMASWRLNESFLRDVTAGEAELRQTLSLLGATLDATADGLLVVDRDGRITSFNRRFVELWDMPVDVLEARDDDRALTHVLDQLENPQAFIDKVRELYAQPEQTSQDVLIFRDGRIFERFSTPQLVDGSIVGRVWSFRDATEERRLAEELSHQAFHDALTGLANQALFRDRVDHALARVARRSAQLAVLFVDLDGFKRVNDSLGHRAGDELLQSMAERLRGTLRTSDTPARLGGDEFAVLLEDLDSEAEAVEVAKRVLASLRHPFAPAGRDVVLGASIGIAFSTPGSTSDQLLRNADLAMYTAKRDRSGSYEIYRSDMHAQALERLELEADLRRALEHDELFVLYQPIVEPGDGRIEGFEALARWRHPTRGVIGPDLFIPLAEETGLIRQLGRFVLDRACRQTRAWHDRGWTPTISVNLSPLELYNETISDEVGAVLRATGLEPRYLTLEITETAMMTDSDTAIARLTDLKRLGVRLAVDDFGTGYSSLSYLERFPVDILKIDRSFVASIDSADGQVSLASAIVSLARTLQLSAVAEGVETLDQARVLTGLGCDLAQGYLFSHPAQPEDATALLEAGRPSIEAHTIQAELSQTVA